MHTPSGQLETGTTTGCQSRHHAAAARGKCDESLAPPAASDPPLAWYTSRERTSSYCDSPARAVNPPLFRKSGTGSIFGGSSAAPKRTPFPGFVGVGGGEAGFCHKRWSGVGSQ